ncbi:MAG: (d)CMP kinase [Spirochaetes bacterium]|nr:(d)CMP kinase [Spirochaetota bacterium]
MTENRKIIIAVDGPAGSGKSSISKEVAKQLKLKYIDSGAVYRAITWYLLEKHDEIPAKHNLSDYLKDVFFDQVFNEDGTCSTFLNERDISNDIRTEVIAKNIGIVSDDISVRELVNSILRKWSEMYSVIMDGRDIGSVVFPDANIKIYLDASVDVRAVRRFEEYKETGKNVDIKDIKKQIALRDTQDMSRPFGKLERREDAIYIDTSEMKKEDVIRKVCSIIKDYSM